MEVVVLAKAHYKVAKFPSHRGVSVQQLQSDYQAPRFLSALKDFLSSRATRDKVILPMETDRFDVFNQLYVESSPSMVTGHGSGWQKIRAKPKVAASGRKAESPARFDTTFVWDEGHGPNDYFEPNGTFPASTASCADDQFSDPCRASACHIQIARSSQPLPPSTGLRRMVHLAPSPRSNFSPVHRHPFDAQPSAQCVSDQY